MNDDDRDFGDAKKTRRAKAALPADGGRLPPHSDEAEQGTLGCVLLSPQDALSEAEERGVTDAWFYDLRNRLLWATLTAMNAEGKGIDLITVQQRLRDQGQLNDCGGLAYLAGLPDLVPSAANLGYYIEILSDQWMLRRVLGIGTNIVAQVCAEPEKGHPLDVRLLVDKFERDVLALSEAGAVAAETHVKPLVIENVNRFEEYHRGSAQMTGLTTGIEYLDKLTGGLGDENGNFIVLAARPGMGKTSLGLDLALHVALDSEWFTPVPLEEARKRGIDGETLRLSKDESMAWEQHRGRPTAFFTLEMSPVRLARRMLFQRSGADLQRFRTGYANGEDFERMTKAALEIQLGPVWIDGTKRLTIDMLKARCRRLVRQRGIKMFVLDYLQLMKSDRRRYRTPDRVAEMEEISAEIAGLGCELNVPFIILAQLNRDMEKAERKRRPQLSDIKNCGAVEQDADVVMMLYEPKLDGEKDEQWDAARTQMYGANQEDWSKAPRRINCLVEKNRDGMTGDCELLFHRSNTHFEDYNEWLKRNGIKAPAMGERKRDGEAEGML